MEQVPPVEVAGVEYGHVDEEQGEQPTLALRILVNRPNVRTQRNQTRNDCELSKCLVAKQKSI